MNPQTSEGVTIDYNDKSMTVDDVVKKMSNADQHISNIEAENLDLRNQIEEFKKAAIETIAPENKSDETPESGGDNPTGLSAEDVVRLARQVLSEDRAIQQSESNAKQVDDYVTSVVGDPEQAKQLLEVKAAELGVNKDLLVKLKSDSPELVKSWFKETKQAPGISTTSSTRNTLAIGNNGEPKEGTWAYWQKLRRENPKLYNSPQMAMKRHMEAKQAREEGRDF